MTNKEFIDTVTVCKGINTLKDKTHINRIYNSDANVELMLNWWLKQEILEDVMALKLIEVLLDIDNGSIGNLERQLIRYFKLNTNFEGNIGIMTLSKGKVSIIRIEELDMDKREKILKDLISNNDVDLVLTCYSRLEDV